MTTAVDMGRNATKQTNSITLSSIEGSGQTTQWCRLPEHWLLAYTKFRWRWRRLAMLDQHGHSKEAFAYMWYIPKPYVPAEIVCKTKDLWKNSWLRFPLLNLYFAGGDICRQQKSSLAKKVKKTHLKEIWAGSLGRYICQMVTQVSQGGHSGDGNLAKCRLVQTCHPPFKLRISKWCSVSSLGHRIFKRLAKALVRLRVCAGWSEALLVAHTTLFEICRCLYYQF